MRRMHLRRGSCAIRHLGDCDPRPSLHHVLPRKPHLGDDVEANLVFLCGSGTEGHHGLVEHHDPAACRALYEHIRTHRIDTIGYLVDKFGDEEMALAWLERHYLPSGEVAFQE